MLNKTYSELCKLHTFEERYKYLKIGGLVGSETFGSDRYLNQALYKSSEWKRFRQSIILRDNGQDMGCDGYFIADRVIIHHINPISADDIRNRSELIFDPENVICVSYNTHQAIHYGSIDLLPSTYVTRSPNDTCPWR